ncbi:UDP-N-acetylmuramoyl-L-alanyl-D-glutamate--2,6-diaminopimelate ligase [Deinococcus peraridilitoris]|uniref:UDP-N-acetylmuramyl-tripeptide synthetase n=1 Tax=Deinococcus peraridilitoris (strain DSM 19664 / LMG 22246 / CIP 109416 / KR-200) TaxID=937777 RepID=L0A4R8_DEIPD|nr:UDP-N-acetylmuramoyl-L-alanyl-D-glutamate--2,6-diaminopimelate ligase [Deinococcus peraridilitoris]AFZ68157.1 UDP-N-acetylmuramyl-tripeptide synthetase [Deinococcus peraridilitoris DSM 19664]
MKLSHLAAALHLPSPPHDPEVEGVTHVAQWVKPGDVFVAIQGARHDGHNFIAQVVERGAVAVAGEGYARPCAVPYLQVPSARAALADLAAELSQHPSRTLRTVGVTGTDGKTTTSWLTLHLLRTAGLQTGLLSTVGYQLPDGLLRHFPAHFTTPEAPQVQATLREIVEAGGQAAVVEASSHALALERLRAVEWEVGVWTHLSSEHLDFHGTVEAYFAEKRKLIERARFAVLNADDPWTERLKLGDHTTYGVDSEATWRAHGIEEIAAGLRFRVTSPLGDFGVELPMIGRFNVQNALGAMAAATHLGADAAQLQAGLASFGGVPGRMQIVSGGPRRVIVDFAHTPPSLEKALLALRQTTAGRLIVVIGSAGGARDPSKRAPLGAVATTLADQAIFTEEDHRDTPLEEILTEMARGARAAGRQNFELVPDRRDAIQRALSQARAGDTVLLAGKGPEDTLERGHVLLPWNEVEEARAALAGGAHV